ncbi:hypothetical protein HA402_014636 [Bradysia odoriphaga]|nr:hypothetical protein HA402_014636 [Bradysia odoriphaga]
MTSQLAIYSGQLVWAFNSTDPYWPSIVCASESGDIENTNNGREKAVHVKLCANRKSDWIQLDNVFEFTGYESYVTRKRSLESILPEDDFHKAFDTANNEVWRSAVVEATFILSKDVNSRLGIFETLNILDDISYELTKIASNITFEDANPEPLISTGQVQRRLTRRLIPTFKASSNRRRSEPLPTTTAEPESRGRKSLLANKPKPPSKFEMFETDLQTYQMDSYPKEILFQGARAGNICKICYMIDDTDDGDLVKCSACGDYAHNSCLNNNNDESYIQLAEQDDPKERRKSSSIRIRIEKKVLCFECQPPYICFACKEVTDTQLKKCDVKSCSRYYHTECLDSWKQIELTNSKLKCPLHVCHTCYPIRDDRTTTSMKFTFCVKCPTVYHLDSNCIPAGTIILTQKQHICIRHRCETRHLVPNLDWCARCGEEGNTLICCGSCPKTFHMSCLDTSEVSHPFLCEDCVNGNNPLYGQMIIAKYGIHPWWPAVIVPAFKVPTHMLKKQPKAHEFCIRFFGAYSFGWIRRSSVHFYSKGEAAKFLIDGDQKQAKAFKEAESWFDKIQKRDSDSSTSSISNNNTIVINLERNVTQSSPQPPQYAKVTTVHAVAPAKLIKSKDGPCKCSCTPDDPCGLTSNCENRDMCIECDPMHCGANCNNQCFERKIFAAVKVTFMDEKKGFGLVADEFINAGQLVIEYVGELITENELERRKSRKENQPGAQHYYFMTYTKGLYIDAEKKGNESRFVNHSCVPNCETQKWTVNKVDRIGYFALKDIEKGTEITTNYGFGRGEFHQCFCGEKKCKGVIGNGNSKK